MKAFTMKAMKKAEAKAKPKAFTTRGASACAARGAHRDHGERQKGEKARSKAKSR